MNKQTEVREHLIELFKQTDFDKETPEQIADAVLWVENEDGVVRKVDRELPKHRLGKAKLVDEASLIYEIEDEHFCFTAAYRVNYIRGYCEAQQDMLRAGYVAVEPLIQDDNFTMDD